MSTITPPLAVNKAKESSTTTLLLGVTSSWILYVSNTIPSPNSPIEPIDVMGRGIDLVSKIFSSSQVSAIDYAADLSVYVPKTPLGKKLVALREAAIARGMRLLASDEISEEIARRRGDSM